jgi:type III secretion protein I
MIDALPSGLPLGSPIAAASPGSVAASDVQRFRSALNTDDATPAVAHATPSPRDAVSVAPHAAQAPVTAGDAILSGLKTASADISQAWLQATQAAGKPSISTAEMLGVQATLLQASVHFELLSKGISKTTQSLDQILKTQ